MAYSQAHRLPLPADSSGSTRNCIGSANLSFVVDQTKLNPSFEAYKLIQDEPSSSKATSYSLPSQPPSLTDLYRSRTDAATTQDGGLATSGLGYKQTKERTLHQLLVPTQGNRSNDEPFAAYIDSNGFIVALTYDKRAEKVVGHPVHRLARQERAGSLPSLASISSKKWLACNGTTLTLIELQQIKAVKDGSVRWSNGTELRWNLPTEGTIKAGQAFDGRIKVLFQSTKAVTRSENARVEEDMKGLGYQKERSKLGSSKDEQVWHSSTAFHVQLLVLDPKEDDVRPSVSEARSLWSVHGEEPAITIKLGDHETLLGAEAPYTATQRVPAPLDVAAQTQQDTTTSNTKATPQPTSATRGRRRPPHFSWAQTGDTVTIAFVLPSWITKAHIRAHFSLSAFSLSFTQEALALLNTPNPTAKITEIGADMETSTAAEDDDTTHAARMIASGRYVSRSTWAEIDPSGSLWTLERARGMSLLTLHLEKRHEGTRWMQVFADRTAGRTSGRNLPFSQGQTQISFGQARSAFEQSAAGRASTENQDDLGGDDDGAEDNEDDVPETMDPSELISMLEGMDKYTVDDESTQHGNGFGTDRSGLSSALDQPSLLKDSLEEEDANVGRKFVLTSVSAADSTVVETSKDGETILLASGLPSDGNHDDLIVIKHDLDGAVFSCTESRWDHVATMPALAFVLASKRDAQRVHVHRRTSKADQKEEYVVLAFESAPRVTGSESTASAYGAGNLFLYYSSASSGAKNAPSRVVRLGASSSDQGDGGASGALLGVCSVRLPRSGNSESEEELEDTLVCLCENRILLLRGLL